jgi:hypothetical protein
MDNIFQSLVAISWLCGTISLGALASDMQQLIEGRVYKNPTGVFCISLQAAKELISLRNEITNMSPMPKDCFASEIEFEASYKVVDISGEMETRILDPYGPDLCPATDGRKLNCRIIRQKNGFVAARMNYRGSPIRVFVLVDDRVEVLPKDMAR